MQDIKGDLKQVYPVFAKFAAVFSFVKTVPDDIGRQLDQEMRRETRPYAKYALGTRSSIFKKLADSLTDEIEGYISELSLYCLIYASMLVEEKDRLNNVITATLPSDDVKSIQKVKWKLAMHE